MQKDIRGRTLIEIQMSLINNKLTSENTTEDTGKVYYSKQNYSDKSKPHTAYATLEKDYWFLDGTKENIPDSNYAVQPLIYEYLTNENCEFGEDAKPTITITATDTSQTYSLIGIAFNFDEIDGDYATDITIERYANGVLIGTHNISNNLIKYESEFSLEDFHQLKIYFNKMNKPYRRLRLTEMTLGLLVEYTENDVIETIHNKEVDPLSRELIQNSFEFTVDNYSGQYNADNPTTTNKFLQDFQEISVKYFQELDEGTYEELDGGKYYLKGTPTVNKNEATFTATGIVEQMTDIYYRTYDENGISFKALLEDIFAKKVMPSSLGSINYEIDESLGAIICNVPIPALPANELIQLICNATNMICFEDRQGVIHIAPNNTETVDYKYDLNEQYSYPKVSTLAKLKNINVNYYNKKISTENKEIFSDTYTNLTVGEVTTIMVTYSNPCKGAVATVTNATVNSVTYYAYGCELNITPTSASVSVTIKGYEIEINNSIATLKVNENGEDCDIDNSLITSREQAINVANQFKQYLLYRNTYAIETRGNIAIDINDVVKMETQFSNEIQGIITSNKLTYNGAIKSDLEIKGLF